MSHGVLLVDPDTDVLNAMARALRGAFVPTVAHDWEEAIAALKTERFACLVTAHRLGAHNGLHLVLRARAGATDVVTIVTTPSPDPVLEKEAASFGALTLVAPWTDADRLVAAVSGGTRVEPA